MNLLDRKSMIQVEDEHGPFYLTHGVNQNTKITVEGRKWMICRCCIRDRIRAKENDIVNCIALIAIMEPILAEIAVMRFELGWKTTKIAKRYSVKYSRILSLEKRVIRQIREGVCSNAKR